MKINHRKFNRQNILPKQSESNTLYVFDSVSKGDSMRKLLKYKTMYDNLLYFRQKRERAMDYAYGRQWNDEVYDWEENRWVREKDLILKQKRTPFQNNIIHQILNVVVGLMRSNKTIPQAITRDRDEQKVGEMMSIVLEEIYNDNNIPELDIETFEEYSISGLAINSVNYEWDRERLINKVSTEKVEPTMLFFNSDYTNSKNLTVIGILYDMTLTEVIARFYGGSKERAEWIRSLYSMTVDKDYIQSQYFAFSGRRFSNTDFFISKENKCRVICAWELESKERYHCFDWLMGEPSVRELADRNLIETENSNRIAEAALQGVAEEDVLLIEYSREIDQFWYVRYFTPTGEILFEQETPFEHNGTPLTISVRTGVDGRIYSFVDFLIDPQRQINRPLSQIDFILNTAVKDVLMIAEESLGKSSKEEVLNEYSRAGGVVVYKATDGKGNILPPPKRFDGGSASTVGLFEMVQFYINQIQTQSGANAALQGQTPSPGTPAYRYAQESQNATNNLRDLLDRFTAFRRQRDLKILKTAAQYYTEKRYINIAGKQYSEESKYFDPAKVRNVEFDIAISEAPQSPTFRAMLDDLLLQLFNNPAAQAQGFDLLTYLRNISNPQADSLARQIEANQKKIQEQQMQQAGQMPPTALEQQGITPELQQQIAEQADPNTMRLLEQYAAGAQ